MRKIIILPASLAAIILFSAPVFADIILPSVVKTLSAAGPSSLLIYPVIYTVPLLLIITLIEALIAKRLLKRSFAVLFMYLYVINIVTSAIGLLTMPKGDEIWPGIPLAFLATTVIEGFMLLLILEHGKRKVLAGLGASAVMNAASYAFLSAVIAGALYLPASTCRDNMPLSELSGKLVFGMSHEKTQVIELPGKNNSTDSAERYKLDPDLRYAVVTKGKKRSIIDKKTGKTLGLIKPGIVFKGCWHFSCDGRFYANWVWADANLGLNGGDLVVGDTKTGKVKAFPRPECQIFSPVDSRLAIAYKGKCTIYDPAKGSIKTIDMPCMSGSEDITWSPDGKYLAYLADMSPYNHDIGGSYTDAVRVISSDGRKSVTVRRKQGDCDWWHVQWTK